MLTKNSRMGKLLIILFFISLPAFAQMKDYSIKLGGQFNFLIPNTEFSDLQDIRFSPLTRAFLRFELSQLIEVELGGGFGYINGYDYLDDYYKTSLIEYGARVLFRPLNSKKWNPYFFVGLERIHYEVDDWPKYMNRKDTDKNVTGIPAGVGVEIPLSENLIFDFSVSGMYALDDGLNSYESDRIIMNDGHWNIGAGLTLSFKSDPDPDKDGLTTEQEEQLGTDPDNNDSDGDGLSDGDEVNKYRTNPLKEDSDGDNLSDRKEIKIHQTDPNKKDTDDDGLEDDLEIQTYKTDPNVADTDKDGLVDGKEVQLKTDPLEKDTDGDGLTDGDEVKIYKTDPLKTDTDGGSLNDYLEVKKGKNPLVPEDDVDVKEEVKLDVNYSFGNIYFETNKSDLDEQSRKVLRDVMRAMNKIAELNIAVIGYTDSVGSANYNQRLSVNRAKAVMNWLTERGVSAKRIKVMGEGENNPIADNSTKEGRSKNRRIEIKIIE